MSGERSRHKLLEFLDYLSDKGLMNQVTVASRKAAVNKILGILAAEEAEDVTKLDLDDVMVRFHNLEGKSYTPGSLQTYRSRLKSAVDDFESYLENPLGFRPSVQAKEKRKLEAKVVAANSEPQPIGERPVVKVPLSSSILPIPIRPDLTIFVQGLPYDLTDTEASKIANVIRAMAMPI